MSLLLLHVVVGIAQFVLKGVQREFKMHLEIKLSRTAKGYVDENVSGDC